METTYKIIGSDGNEYGPVTLEQFRAWIAEGRVLPETKVQRSDQPHWQSASDYSELGLAKPAVEKTPSISPPISANIPVEPIQDKRIKGGASWFLWIAGLSLVNSVVALTGSSWRFIFGLGLTQVIDAFAMSRGTAGSVVALVLDAIIAGIFIFLGVFAGKGRSWAFLVGMIFFGLDGLLTLLFQDWISLAFHAFALFGIFKGFQAAREA